MYKMQIQIQMTLLSEFCVISVNLVQYFSAPVMYRTTSATNYHYRLRFISFLMCILSFNK